MPASKIRGILVDINVQGHLRRIQQALRAMDLEHVLTAGGISFFTFADFQLQKRTDDRRIWNLCQHERLVLLTENRNNDGPDSLDQTIRDSLTPESLPVITLANKGAFESSSVIAAKAAADLAEVVFSLIDEPAYIGVPRVYIPLAPRTPVD